MQYRILWYSDSTTDETVIHLVDSIFDGCKKIEELIGKHNQASNYLYVFEVYSPIRDEWVQWYEHETDTDDPLEYIKDLMSKRRLNDERI